MRSSREIDSIIEEKENEAHATKDRNLKHELRNKVKELEKEKKNLTRDAKKLIDLSHKTLVILDTPSPGLFAALMSLLSHDRYEVTDLIISEPRMYDTNMFAIGKGEGREWA